MIKKSQVFKKSLPVFLSLLLAMPIIGNVGVNLAWADEVESSVASAEEEALDTELLEVEESSTEALGVEETLAFPIIETLELPESSSLVLFGLSDEELFALGGKEELTDKIATWLLEQGSSISAVTLIFFEEKDDVLAIFEGNDTALSRFSVGYNGFDYEFVFFFEPTELLVSEDEGVEEELLAPLGDTLESATLTDSASVPIMPLADIIPLAVPPSGFIGSFVLASWFSCTPSYEGNFPGSITLSDSSLTIVSFGDNSPYYNNERAYCVRVGAANWGDPYNGNYRVGTVYAEFVSADTARGIAWYKITIVPNPPAIPAAPGSTIGVQVIEARLALRWNFDGIIELYKSSANPSITDGNACYSLEGAQYGIYRSYSDALNDINRVQVLTTNSSGYAKSGSLTQSTYYVKEICASPGYDKDLSIYTVSLNSAVYTLRVNEVPAGDPILTLVQKLDAKTGGAYGFDDSTGIGLAGAQFTIRYYDGYYDTVEKAEVSGDPTRTWVIETGEGGAATLRPERLVVGISDPLYMSIGGNALIPLGTLLVQETRAPDRYLLPDPNPVTLQQVLFDKDLDEVIRFNPLEVPNEPRELQLIKTDAMTDEVLGGAVFEIHKESTPGAGDWEKLYTKTTDDDGSFLVSPIEAGSYKLIEIKAPVGYLLPSDSGLPVEILFTVEEGDALTVIKAENYKDEIIIIGKSDIDTAAPIPDTEFTIFRYPVEIVDGIVVSDTSLITADMSGWVNMGKATTDKDGKATFEGLPYGYYKLVETKPHIEYASYEESGGIDRFVILDKNSTYEVQIFEDMAIKVSCDVDKETIEKTSSAHDPSIITPAPIMPVAVALSAAAPVSVVPMAVDSTSEPFSGVSIEEYIVRFSAISTSNVWADEFMIEDDLTPTTDLGYRMTKLWTGTSPDGLDFDGLMTIAYRTNFSEGTATPTGGLLDSIMTGNPDNPNNPDRVILWGLEGGWRIWAAGVSITTQVRLDVADLGLADGEYITGLRVFYGGVKVGFFVGSTYGAGYESFAYALVATGALTPTKADGSETVMRGSIVTRIARNIVLTDYAYDEVATRVLGSFEIPTTTRGLTAEPMLTSYPSTPLRRLPQTGDNLMLLEIMATLIVFGLASVIASRQRRKSEVKKR